MERPSGHSNTNLDLVHYGPQSPGANLSGKSGHAGTTAAKSASPGITLLKGRTAGVQRLAVKICDNHASWRQASIFKSATIRPDPDLARRWSLFISPGARIGDRRTQADLSGLIRPIVRIPDDTPGAALHQFRAVSVFPGNLRPARRHFTAVADLIVGAPGLVQHLNAAGILGLELISRHVGGAHTMVRINHEDSSTALNSGVPSEENVRSRAAPARPSTESPDLFVLQPHVHR